MLKELHRKDLKRSGLADATIMASGCRSLSREEVKRLVGFDPETGGYSIPYPQPDGQAFERVRLDKPYQAPGWKKPAKYLTPAGESNRLYIPSILSMSALQDTTVPLIVTEGEKKGLKANQEGFLCVALAGVWCFRSKATGRSWPIPDLDLVAWEGREVFICFDADAVTNPNVRGAERALSEELQGRGAKVKVVRIPALPDLEKTGLDDYLIHEGPEAFRARLEEAQHPTTEGLKADPKFVDAALAFVDGKAMVSRMFLEERTETERKGEAVTYTAWTARLVTSAGEIIEIPRPASKDREEILPLGGGYFLKQRPDAAPTRWSVPSIRAFVSGAAAAPDVPTLYDELLDAWKTWVYLPEESAYHLIVLHVLGSYFFELWPAYPYLHFNGPPDSGKSTNGRLCAALGFNGRFMIDPSEASLFRTIERERPYLVLDEKEDARTRQDAAADPGLMALLKAGYQRGARIPRQNTRNVERTEYFSVYSPKAICNVHGLEDILADRSIPIITEEAPAGSDIRGVQPDLDDPAWQPLRDRLYLCLMHHHAQVEEIRDADLSGERSRLREKELFKPLIDLAYFVDAHRSGEAWTVAAVQHALTTNRDARTFTRSLMPEAQLCAALLDLRTAPRTRRSMPARSGRPWPTHRQTRRNGSTSGGWARPCERSVSGGPNGTMPAASR